MALLLSETRLGPLVLRSRLVMAPMTRNRAINNIPNELMAKYYTQRSTAGLIITEGTAPSPNALGYPRIPGIFTKEQIDGWKVITDAVHYCGARIFMQLMHTGRISHPLNMPVGARVLAPSAIAANEQMHTDAEGVKPLPTPEQMTEEDINLTVEEFVQAAKNAVEAGFDGVELHAANGYLLEQFIRPNTNQRTDGYGGSIERRVRFVLKTVNSVSSAIGKDRVGIRLSPFGVYNDMPLYDAMEADYAYLARQLNNSGALLYIHLVDHSSMGAPKVPDSIKAMFRKTFGGALILSGGYTALSAEIDLVEHKADLIAVGRPFLANPDLPMRWLHGDTLNVPDPATFYTPGEQGYTTYRSIR